MPQISSGCRLVPCPQRVISRSSLSLIEREGRPQGPFTRFYEKAKQWLDDNQFESRLFCIVLSEAACEEIEWCQRGHNT